MSNQTQKIVATARRVVVVDNGPKMRGVFLNPTSLNVAKMLAAELGEGGPVVLGQLRFDRSYWEEVEAHLSAILDSDGGPTDV